MQAQKNGSKTVEVLSTEDGERDEERSFFKGGCQNILGSGEGSFGGFCTKRRGAKGCSRRKEER